MSEFDEMDNLLRKALWDLRENYAREFGEQFTRMIYGFDRDEFHKEFVMPFVENARRARPPNSEFLFIRRTFTPKQFQHIWDMWSDDRRVRYVKMLLGDNT